MLTPTFDLEPLILYNTARRWLETIELHIFYTLIWFIRPFHQRHLMISIYPFVSFMLKREHNLVVF